MTTDLFTNRKRSKHKCATHIIQDFPKGIRRNIGMSVDETVEELSIDIKERHSDKLKAFTFDVFGVDMQSVKLSKEHSVNLCVIISGGESTEKEYFKQVLNNPAYFPRLKLSFVTGTDELHRMIQHAAGQKQLLEDILREKGADEQIEGDMIVLLTDVDHFKEDILKSIPVCKNKGYDLIISNPCFEVWLYYSKYSQFPSAFTPSSRGTISSDFKRYIDRLNADSEGDKIDYPKAIFGFGYNIMNSKANYAEDLPDFPICYATQMHVLMEKISPFITDGLKKVEANINKLGAFHRGSKKSE